MANCKIFMLATLNLSIAPADPYPSVKTRDAVTSMDLSSKDFSLNFRGFEHDDPETVKREIHRRFDGVVDRVQMGLSSTALNLRE